MEGGKEGPEGEEGREIPNRENGKGREESRRKGNDAQVSSELTCKVPNARGRPCNAERG